MQFCIFSQKFNFARENKSDKNFCEKNATISQKILHFFTNEIQKQNFTKNAKFSRNDFPISWKHYQAEECYSAERIFFLICQNFILNPFKMVRKRHNKIYFVLYQGNNLFIKTYLTRAENF